MYLYNTAAHVVSTREPDCHVVVQGVLQPLALGAILLIMKWRFKAYEKRKHITCTIGIHLVSVAGVGVLSRSLPRNIPGDEQHERYQAQTYFSCQPSSSALKHTSLFKSTLSIVTKNYCQQNLLVMTTDWLEGYSELDYWEYLFFTKELFLYFYFAPSEDLFNQLTTHSFAISGLCFLELRFNSVLCNSLFIALQMLPSVSHYSVDREDAKRIAQFKSSRRTYPYMFLSNVLTALSCNTHVLFFDSERKEILRHSNTAIADGTLISNQLVWLNLHEYLS